VETPGEYKRLTVHFMSVDNYGAALLPLSTCDTLDLHSALALELFSSCHCNLSCRSVAVALSRLSFAVCRRGDQQHMYGTSTALLYHTMM
jgi:hypothetical protein